jgi:light-regulated signal transduction histidine kinase (bacteriophytochrome)
MTDSGRASFRRIQSALTRVSLLLDDVITLTQINIAQQPEHMVDMTELMHEITAGLSAKIKGNNVQLTTGDLCEIRAHRNQVILLIQHVLLNAIRFNQSGQPRLHISCEKITWQGKEYYQLSIIHNGDGFALKEAASAFNFDFSGEEKQYNHSAIASIIAAKVMEAHGGFLAIETTDAGEREIKCYFPVGEDKTC